MKSTEEKVAEIFTNIFMLPQIKDAYYDTIIKAAIPIMVDNMKATYDIDADEMLEWLYNMEVEELKELVNGLVNAVCEFEITTDTIEYMQNMMDYLKHKDEEEEL